MAVSRIRDSECDYWLEGWNQVSLRSRLWTWLSHPVSVSFFECNNFICVCAVFGRHLTRLMILQMFRDGEELLSAQLVSSDNWHVPSMGLVPIAVSNVTYWNRCSVCCFSTTVLSFFLFLLRFWTDAFGTLKEGEGRAIDGKSASDKWMGWWTVFYMAWWVAWSW